MKDPCTHGRPFQTQQISVENGTRRALFLRNDPAGYSSLVDQLEQFGWECQVACFPEGLALLGREHFHIIFSEACIPESTMARLISRSTGSKAYLFLHLQVEDGCWWLPAVIAGRDARERPALTREDFNGFLMRLVQELR